MSFQDQLAERRRRLAMARNPSPASVAINNRPNLMFRGVPIPDGIVQIQGGGQRKKVHTKQIQDKAKSKGQKSGGKKITQKEELFMRAKRLQQLSPTEEAARVYVPSPPKRFIPLSDDERAFKEFNLTEADHVQNVPPVSD